MRKSVLLSRATNRPDTPHRSERPKTKHSRKTWWNPENIILRKQLQEVGMSKPMETPKILTSSTVKI
jgi:hypothetical protein